MKKKVFFVGLVACCFFSFFLGCHSVDDNPGGQSDQFDRQAMLKNWADNLIIPALEDFSQSLDQLLIATQGFTTNPDVPSLHNLRTKWLDSYKIWQHVAMYQIGKAEQISYSMFVNVYPVTVSEIVDNIENGLHQGNQPDLTHVNSQDAQGFGAIDYLINGLGDDQNTLTYYINHSASQSYKDYLISLVNRIKQLTTEVLNYWYQNKNQYISNVENSVTGSINLTVNDFIFYLEKNLRASKIGIPAGIFSIGTLPEKVEAFYRKDVSKALALEAFEAVENFFKGNHYGSLIGQQGLSLQAYLTYLHSIGVQDSDKSTQILTEMSKAYNKITLLQDDFTLQISQDNTKMTECYDQIQKVVVLLKVDMLQALNITVDYVDADGD